MKYFTSAQWVQNWNMSRGDMEQGLMELGYQYLDVLGNLTWKPTRKGKDHMKKSWNPFDKTLRWDFEAFFDVVKHYGRKTRRYFYCPECGDLLNHQHGFETSMDKWVCKKCGHVNNLADAVESANALARKYKDVLCAPGVEEPQSKVADVHWKCPQCGREANDIDEINVIFGFVQTPEGKLKPQTNCKECRVSPRGGVVYGCVRGGEVKIE